MGSRCQRCGRPLLDVRPPCSRPTAGCWPCRERCSSASPAWSPGCRSRWQPSASCCSSSPTTGSYGFAGAVSAATYHRRRGGGDRCRAGYLDRLGQSRVLPPLILVFGRGGGPAGRRRCAATGRTSRRSPPRRWPGCACPRSGPACGPGGRTCSTTRGSCRRPTPSSPWSTRRCSSSARSWSPCWPPAGTRSPGCWSWWPPAWPARSVLASQRRTQPPPHPPLVEVADRPRMPWRIVLTLAVVMGALGSLFGSAEVATVAFAEEHGARGATGLLLAAVGARQPAGRDRHRRVAPPARPAASSSG